MARLVTSVRQGAEAYRAVRVDATVIGKGDQVHDDHGRLTGGVNVEGGIPANQAWLSDILHGDEVLTGSFVTASVGYRGRVANRHVGLDAGVGQRREYDQAVQVDWAVIVNVDQINGCYADLAVRVERNGSIPAGQGWRHGVQYGDGAKADLGFTGGIEHGNG